jgi:hypothetical protein
MPATNKNAYPGKIKKTLFYHFQTLVKTAGMPCKRPGATNSFLLTPPGNHALSETPREALGPGGKTGTLPMSGKNYPVLSGFRILIEDTREKSRSQVAIVSIECSSMQAT